MTGIDLVWDFGRTEVNVGYTLLLAVGDYFKLGTQLAGIRGSSISVAAEFLR
jgi:hypothetical protein